MAISEVSRGGQMVEMGLTGNPFKKKLQRVILLASTTVLLFTCVAFLVYEWISFRKDMVRNLATLAEVTALNSTAALAFQNEDDAREILSALRVEKHILAAALYDRNGKLFVSYPLDEPAASFPAAPQKPGPRFIRSNLILFQPVIESGNPLGTLYLK